MRFKILLATALATSLSIPALADDGKARDDDAATRAPKEKKVCRTEMVTGSLVAKRRICMTQAEWDQMARNYQHSMDDYTSRASGLPGTPGNPLSPK